MLCSDLTPLNLLHYLVPDRNYLPPGVEMAYDQLTGVHAFRFLPSTIPPPISDRFSFLAASLLTRHGGSHVTGTANSCPYFPEEFSLLFTFKMSPKRKLKSAEVAQCLFAISRRGTSDIVCVYLLLTARIGQAIIQSLFKSWFHVNIKLF